MAKDKITSGNNLSYWINSVHPKTYEELDREIETDILIIGAGIAGLTTAYCLLLTGRKVIVVDDGLPGSRESGRTTGHLTYALDDRYYNLEKMFGAEKTKLIAQSHLSAINKIEEIIHTENIDCDFKRINGY